MQLARILLLVAAISASCNALSSTATSGLKITSKMVVPDQLRSLDADQMSDKSSMRFLQSRTVEEERAWDINKLDDILNNPDVRNAKFEKWVGKKYKMKDITTKIQAITSVDEKYLRIPLLYGVHSGQISSKMLPKVRYK